MKIDVYLDQLMLFGIKLGLEQERELLKRLGYPQKNLKFLHVAGTNGKGSCCAMLDAALRNAGFKIGFYSSPHLSKVNERFKINGQDIGDAELDSLAERVWQAVESMRKDGFNPTYFEFTTALATLCFAENHCQFVIWETGMGGRFDATNAVDSIIAVITSIALEHTQYLGDTIDKIAFEKAGIIKEDSQVFCGIMDDEAYKVIAAKAGGQKARIFRLRPEAVEPQLNCSAGGFSQKFTCHGHEITIPLAGAFQIDNARLVVEILSFLAAKYEFALDKALQGLKHTNWPGRLQMLADGSIVDGAHNPAGIKMLHDFLEQTFPNEKFSFVFAAFDDKNAAESLKILSPLANEFIFCELPGERPCHTPTQLAAMLKNKNIETRQCPSPTEGCKLPVKNRRVICGSLYLAGYACFGQ